MNAPQDPRESGGPPYGGPPGYGGQQGYGGQPGYGQQPGVNGGAPAYGQPPAYGGDPATYAYNPYGSPYPVDAAQATPAPRRPGLMVLALLMTVLAALPFLFVGAAVLLVPIDANGLPSELLDNPQLLAAGATPQLLVSLVRTVGVVVLVVALLYLLFGVLAFAGRNWSRIIVTILSVGFVLLLVAALITAGGDVSTLVVFGTLLVLVVGSVVITFLPASNHWYTHRR